MIAPGIGPIPIPNILWSDKWKRYNAPLTFWLNRESYVPFPDFTLHILLPDGVHSLFLFSVIGRSFHIPWRPKRVLRILPTNSRILVSDLSMCRRRPLLVHSSLPPPPLDHRPFNRARDLYSPKLTISKVPPHARRPFPQICQSLAYIFLLLHMDRNLYPISLCTIRVDLDPVHRYGRSEREAVYRWRVVGAAVSGLLRLYYRGDSTRGR